MSNMVLGLSRRQYRPAHSISAARLPAVDFSTPFLACRRAVIYIQCFRTVRAQIVRHYP